MNLSLDFVNKEYAIRNANPDKYDAPRQRFGDVNKKHVCFLKF
jgi:iron complex outermembrane receptor protein